jgi:hypothetical protein
MKQTRRPHLTRRTSAVCKVRGLNLLLRGRTSWSCGDGLFFEVPPLESDAPLTTLHPLLENVLQTVDHFEISSLGAPFLWLEKPRNRIRARSELNSLFGLEKVDRWDPIRTSAIQSRSRPAHAISGLFQPWKGSSEARNFEVINGLQHVFEKWVERCKKCIACRGRYLERDRYCTSTKFRLGITRWVHELCKRPSYI